MAVLLRYVGFVQVYTGPTVYLVISTTVVAAAYLW